MKRVLRQFLRIFTGFVASLLPSPRLAVYVGLGAALWVAAAFVPAWRALVVLYDVVLLLVAGCDLILSPRPRDLEIRREFESKMNLGAANEVRLHARNRSKLPVSLVVRDETPPGWIVTREDEAAIAQNSPDTAPLPTLPRVTLRLEAGREGSDGYGLTPARRGDFRFGALHARYPTVLGLWFRQFKSTPENDAARVYPDISAVKRYELALREGKMRDIGLHLLRLRGQGTEFESLREYNSSDEYKAINWKASARRGKLISTNYEIERDQTIVICLDCGRMMTSMAVAKSKDEGGRMKDEGAPDHPSSLILHPSTPTPLSKLDCAINATVLLAHVAASMGDSVGLLLFSDGVLKWLPPRKGRLQTGQIIEALYSAQPSLVEPDYQVAYEHFDGASGAARVSCHFHRHYRRRSLARTAERVGRAAASSQRAVRDHQQPRRERNGRANAAVRKPTLRKSDGSAHAFRARRRPRTLARKRRRHPGCRCQRTDDFNGKSVFESEKPRRALSGGNREQARGNSGCVEAPKLLPFAFPYCLRAFARAVAAQIILEKRAVGRFGANFDL